MLGYWRKIMDSINSPAAKTKFDSDCKLKGQKTKAMGAAQEILFLPFRARSDFIKPAPGGVQQ